MQETENKPIYMTLAMINRDTSMKNKNNNNND